MRRRAFVQLGGTYAALAMMPGLAALTGCGTDDSVTADRRLDAPSGPGTEAPGTGTPGSLATGDAGRSFASDGRSAEIRAHEVEVFSPSGARAHVLGDARRLGSDDVGTFNAPTVTAWDPSGRLLVLERGGSRIQAFDASGKALGVLVTTALHPSDLFVDARDGSMYVVAPTAHRVDVYSADGRLTRTIGSFGTTTAGLNGPSGVALAPDGSIHVVDSGSAQVKVFGVGGSHLGNYGGANAITGRLRAPRTIRFDGAGNAWVGDLFGKAIHVFDARGRFLERKELRLADGRPAAPRALASLPDGGIYAALIAAG